MTLNRFAELPRRLYRMLISLWNGDIYYVTDKSDWSIDWDAHYITTALADRHGLSTRVISSPWGLSNKIIHFGDRYAYLNGPYEKLLPSNHVFLTWFHGDPANSNPAMQHLFGVLQDAVQYVEKVVVTCQISRRVLVEQGIAERKLVTIPLGVELARFTPPTGEVRSCIRDRLGIPQDAICIGSFQKDGVGWGVGNEPKLVKGPDVFLDVIAELATRYDDLFILLTGPARGYVKHGLEQLGVPYLHHFLADYLDIGRYYQAIDLYVVTSRTEGGPKGLLESWATGIPVVSTRMGMSADLIRHGQNGMLAEIDDVNGLVEHAVALLEDSALHEKCRRKALEDVSQYHWPLIADQYFQKLYRPYLKQELLRPASSV